MVVFSSVILFNGPLDGLILDGDLELVPWATLNRFLAEVSDLVVLVGLAVIVLIGLD